MRITLVACHTAAVATLLACALPAAGLWAQTPLAGSDARRVQVSTFADFLQKGLEHLNDAGIQKQTMASLQSQEPKIRDVLSWIGSGRGVLLEGEVAKGIGEAPQPRILVGEGVRFLGGGQNSYDVYKASLRLPALTQLRPDGFDRDNDSSFFLWVTKNGDALQIKTIDGISATAMRRAAIADNLDEKAASYQQAVSEVNLLNQLVEEAKKRVTDTNVKSHLDEVMTDWKNYKQDRDRIYKDLADAQVRQKNAAQVVSTFETISTVFTIASQIDWTKAGMGSDSPKELNQPDAATKFSSSQILIMIKQVEVTRSNQVGQLKTKADASSATFQKSDSDLRSTLRNRGAPLDSIPSLSMP
jgi:hypothetical protein